jgi:hypothetical protein
MAKAKKGRGKRKAAPRAAAGRRPKKVVRGAGSAAPGTAQKRIAALEAENRRLREEIATLRARLAENPAPPPTSEPGEGQVALNL